MNSYDPPPIPAPRAYQPAPCPRSAWPWIIGAVLLCGIGLFVLAVVGMISAVATGMKEGATSFTSTNMRMEKTVIRSGGADQIAHIDLEGVISASPSRNGSSMVDDFREMMEAAVQDEAIKAIVVRINSPGGEVTASDRLHRIMQQTNEAKPVIAYLDSIAASGGYYAACGSRHIISHPTSFTGSIGVIMQSMKYKELFGKVGLSQEVFKSGELKDLLSGTRETSDKEIKLINTLVQETYSRFLEVVSASRSKSVEELRASPLTDGRIFSGKQALAAGMVDGNGFVEDAYNYAMEAGEASGASVVRYTPKIGFFDIFSQLATTNVSSRRLEIDVSERLVPHLQPGVPLYLHQSGF